MINEKKKWKKTSWFHFFYQLPLIFFVPTYSKTPKTVIISLLILSLKPILIRLLPRFPTQLLLSWMSPHCQTQQSVLSPHFDSSMCRIWFRASLSTRYICFPMAPRCYALPLFLFFTAVSLHLLDGSSWAINFGMSQTLSTKSSLLFSLSSGPWLSAIYVLMTLK